MTPERNRTTRLPWRVTDSGSRAAPIVGSHGPFYTWFIIPCSVISGESVCGGWRERWEETVSSSRNPLKSRTPT